MNPNQYLIESEKTLAPQTEEQRTVAIQDLIDSMDGAFSGNVCDMIKRKIFYKDENAYERFSKESQKITDVVKTISEYKDLGILTQGKMNLFHAMLGVISEGGELVEAISVHIAGQEIDEHNIKEEVGDILWYLAIICRHFDFSFEECMQTNIDKLAARYPDKFTTSAAVNRDLAIERKVIEG